MDNGLRFYLPPWVFDEAAKRGFIDPSDPQYVRHETLPTSLRLTPVVGCEPQALESTGK